MCSNRFENERQSKPVTTTVCFIILYSAEGEVKEKKPTKYRVCCSFEMHTSNLMSAVRTVLSAEFFAWHVNVML